MTENRHAGSRSSRKGQHARIAAALAAEPRHLRITPDTVTAFVEVPPNLQHRMGCASEGQVVAKREDAQAPRRLRSNTRSRCRCGSRGAAVAAGGCFILHGGMP